MRAPAPGWIADLPLEELTLEAESSDALIEGFGRLGRLRKLAAGIVPPGLRDLPVEELTLVGEREDRDWDVIAAMPSLRRLTLGVGRLASAEPLGRLRQLDVLTVEGSVSDDVRVALRRALPDVAVVFW